MPSNSVKIKVETNQAVIVMGLVEDALATRRREIGELEAVRDATLLAIAEAASKVLDRKGKTKNGS